MGIFYFRRRDFFVWKKAVLHSFTQRSTRMPPQLANCAQLYEWNAPNGCSPRSTCIASCKNGTQTVGEGMKRLVNLFIPPPTHTFSVYFIYKKQQRWLFECSPLNHSFYFKRFFIYQIIELHSATKRRASFIILPARLIWISLIAPFPIVNGWRTSKDFATVLVTITWNIT